MNKQFFALLISASAASAFVVPAFAADPAPMRKSASSAAMSSADYKASKEKMEADYKAAKKECEAKKGADERACSKAAEAAHERAEKDLKAMKH